MGCLSNLKSTIEEYFPRECGENFELMGEEIGQLRFYSASRGGKSSIPVETTRPVVEMSGASFHVNQLPTGKANLRKEAGCLCFFRIHQCKNLFYPPSILGQSAKFIHQGPADTLIAIGRVNTDNIDPPDFVPETKIPDACPAKEKADHSVIHFVRLRLTNVSDKRGPRRDAFRVNKPPLPIGRPGKASDHFVNFHDGLKVIFPELPDINRFHHHSSSSGLEPFPAPSLGRV